MKRIMEFELAIYHPTMVMREEFDEKTLFYRVDFILFLEKETKVTDRFLIDKETIAKLPR